jgi:methionyl-tRNA formyltransferase
VLASGLKLVGVYTQPDRPAGRGRDLSASPVKQCALEAGIPVFQPESLRTPAARRELESLAPDLMVVVAYGLILTPQVLAAPKAGCWNVHASILPRWRGAAPIQRALMAGDTETGVDLMQMEKGLDTGPVLLSRRTPILSSDSAGALHDRLALLGADVLAEGLQRWQAGTLPTPRAQAEYGVCYAAKIEKNEAILDFKLSCTELERKVRAFSPWPIAETVLLGERVRVHAAIALPGPATSPAGTLLRASRSGIDVACGDGVLSISRLQRDGGKVVSASDYLNARPMLVPLS